MKAKTFFLASLAVILICFGTLIALLSLEDPFFVLGGIGQEETALFNNQRYEMPGLIRHQDYSAVVMGTSLVANYRASWFTEGLGKETLKITFPDGWVSEFDAALELAFRTHPGLDTVYFCFDPNILIRPDSQRTVELPRYLYNLNPLDDVEYLLNADSYMLALRARLLRRRSETVTLDDAYLWSSHPFSKGWAIVSYPRPEVSDTVLPADAFLDAVDENLKVVCGWAERHPDVKFVIWFPPYSVLYWDMKTREGAAEAVIAAVEHTTVTLLEYDNVAVQCFLDAVDIITNLDFYADHIHCSDTVTFWETQNLLEGGWELTRENCRERLDALRQFAADYDYDAIFAS